MGVLVWALLLVAGLPSARAASATLPRTEYRGFWVDTFHTSLNHHADVEAVVRQAKAAKANALFAQVRRRGDSWYLNSLEPLPDFVPITRGFDPLKDLIETAHANGIEVHAFVIMGAVWNKNPALSPAIAGAGLPKSPDHVFNRHGAFRKSTGRIDANSPDNWLTRTLLPDGGTAGIGFQGHRIGAEFWLDFGHPDAAAFSADVVLHLVRHYDLDGLHLDRIRYPDFAATGQSVTSGANIGYNAVSVRRFQLHYGIAPTEPLPSPADPRWSQWRRDQVTSLVRRIYLNAIAIRPKLVVSAALIAFGGAPVTDESWHKSEPYWRVFQDWRAWLEEGIVDVAIPMNYKREDVKQQAIWYDQWNRWTRNHLYNRTAIAGVGLYLNSIEGSLRQVRRALDTAPLAGVNFFPIASADTAVRINRFSLPTPGRRTPVRGLQALTAALTTGSAAGKYEPPRQYQQAVFADEAQVPKLPWKHAPSLGHLMGVFEGSDTAPVHIYNDAGTLIRSTSTDGSGFFGAVDLPPGTYEVRVSAAADKLIVSKPVSVIAGGVARVTFGE